MDKAIKIKDIVGLKTISLKEASVILGLGYHATRKRVLFEGVIGYFNYGGKISVVEEDVREYKRKHYVAPRGN